MNAEKFFTPSFLCAIEENTEEGFRNIMEEPCPGIFTFDMLRPKFCEKLIREVLHISLLSLSIMYYVMLLLISDYCLGG